MDMRGGCWHKRLYNMYGIRRILEEEHPLQGLLLGGPFSTWGWGDTEDQSRILALDVIIERARAAGILDMATDHKLGMTQHKTRAESRRALWHRVLHQKEKRERESEGERGQDKAEPGPGERHKKRQIQPPYAFSLMKWRTQEHKTPPLMKWRDVFTFTNVVVQSLAKLVGRTLRLLLNEMYMTLTSLALPVMVGV